MLLIFLTIISHVFANPSKLQVLGVDIAGVFDESPPGRERLILNEVFLCMGKTMTVSLAPYGRHISYFAKEDKFDVVATVPPESKVQGFQSDSHIDYENGVTTLKSFRKKIEKPEDLAGLRVVSFNGAQDMLPGMKDAVPLFKSYSEIVNQELHSKMLLMKRADAVVSDRYIFHVHTKRLIEKEPSRKELLRETQFHRIFKPTKFTVSFRNEKLRDEFNRCLKSEKDKISDINQSFLKH